MKKIIRTGFFFILLSFFAASKALAAGCTVPETININNLPLKFTVVPDSNVDLSIVKEVVIYCTTVGASDVKIPLNADSKNTAHLNSDGSINVTFDNVSQSAGQPLKCIKPMGGEKQSGVRILGGESYDQLCYYDFQNVIDDVPIENQCSLTIEPENPPQPGKSYTITVNDISSDATNVKLQMRYDNPDGLGVGWGEVAAPGTGETSIVYNDGGGSLSQHIYFAVTGKLDGESYGLGNSFCETDFIIGEQAGSENNNGSGDTGTTPLTAKDICKFIKDKDTRQKCFECSGKSRDKNGDGVIDQDEIINTTQGIWTDFGCIGVSPQKLITDIIKVAIGLAGGIAFLMMGYASIMWMMSAGNPEAIQQAREVFVSAIAGLLLIIFSVVILNIIGVDILKIPGL